MSHVFRSASPPSNLLCERVLILGVSVESLKRTFHTDLLIRGLTEALPEEIAVFPKLEDDTERFETVHSAVFPGSLIRLSPTPRPASYETHTLTLSGTRMRLHCLKVWEFVDPVIAYQSSTIATPGIVRPGSLKTGELKRRQERDKEAGYFVPVAFCVLTKGKHFRSFRAIIEELFVYVGSLRRNPTFGPVVANAEFTRLLAFLLNDAFLPPKCTKLSVKIGRKLINFPIDYLREPIHNEESMQMLLDLLDADVLITLWQLLLIEKNVIIMGRFNNIIYSVLEGLKILMFPLKWVLTYIPLLDRNPQELIEENKTLLAGVSTETMKFSEVAVKPLEGAVYNLDTGELYLQPKTFTTICQQELNTLKTTILGLKAYQYQFYEHAEVMSEAGNDEDEAKEQSEKWRYMLAAPSELQSDLQILQMRDAFLRPLLENLRNYSSCFTPGLKKNIPDFDVTAFTHKLGRCAIHDCNSVNFWIALVHTMSFQQLMEEHSSWDESNADVFRSLNEVKRTSGSPDILWHLRLQRSTQSIYSFALAPTLVPRTLFQHITDTLDRKSFHPTDNKFNTHLSSGHEYLNFVMDSLEEHAYFSADYATCLKSIDHPPPDLEAQPEPRMWYGSSGLIRHLLLSFECFDYSDFKDLNGNDKLLERMEADGDNAWQALIMKAFVMEEMSMDPVMIAKAYKFAFQQNGGWVPFHRFSKIVELITGPDALDIFADLEHTSDGLFRRIVRTVRSKLQESDARSARSSISLEPSSEIHTPILPPAARLDNEDGKHRLGIMSKAKRIAMGAVRENIGTVEIRTMPLNERVREKGPKRDGAGIVEGLLTSLKKILGKYKSKIENGKINKLFTILDSDPEFKQMSDSIGDLQNIKLTPTALQNPLQTLSLYLNLHNFIVLYAFLVKKQLCNNAIEWNKFLSCLCFIVGGERMTPILIQSVLLRAGFNPEAMELNSFSPMDPNSDHPLTKYQLPMLFPYVHFGLYIPAGFCAGLRIYRAKTVERLLEEQGKAYCQFVEVDEVRRTVALPAIFYIKHFGTDAETLRLIRKVLKGEETGKRLKKLIETEAREVEKLRTMEDWRFTLRKVLLDDVCRKQKGE